MLLKDLLLRHHALRITVIYLAFAALWILASDRALEALFGDVALLTHMQTLKGMMFVVITALMLYLLIARANITPRTATPNHLTPWAPLLIFSMLAIAISLTGWYSYTALKQSLEQDVITDLTRTGKLKKIETEAWLQERRADAAVATKESFLAREASPLLTATGAQQRARLKSIEARLKTYQEQYRYLSISLIDLQGHTQLHIGAEQTKLDSHRAEALQAIQEKRTVFLDLHTHLVGGNPEPFLGFIAPLVFEHQATGALLFYANPETALAPTLGQAIAKLKSEESFLIRLEGSQARILSKQRHSTAPIMSQVREGEFAALARSALTHPSDGVIARYIGDGGRKQLAYAIPVHDTPWILFTQVDEQDIYAPIRRLALISALMTATLLILGASLTWLWWQRERNREAAELAQAALEREVLTQHYDYLSRYANDVIILADQRGIFVEVSERATEVYGYTREEMLGMCMADLRTEEPAIFSGDMDSIEDGLLYEASHRRKDGSRFIAEVSARLIDRDGNNFLHMVIRDITERKQTDIALRESEERFRHLIERVPVALGYATGDGRITFINQRFEQLFGYQQAEIPTMEDWLEQAYPNPDYRRHIGKRWKDTIHRAQLAHADIAPIEAEITCKNGQLRYVLVSGITFGEDILATLIDITERKQAEERVRRLTQLYATLSRINETIVALSSRDMGEDDEQRLYQSVCDIFVHQGGMLLAWIGKREPETQRIIPIVSAGNGQDYLEGIHISADASLPEGCGPTGTAFRENRITLSQDFMHTASTSPWHERAKPYGWRSNASIPICRGGAVHAVLTVYHGMPAAFDQESVRLLTEVAGDIGLALDNLDIRAERIASLEKLRTANLVVENSPTVLWRWVATEGWPTAYVSENVVQFGYSAEDFLSGQVSYASIIHPDDLARVVDEVTRNTANGVQHYHQEYRIRCKDGSIRWIGDDTTVLRDASGQPTYYEGVTSDITLLHEAQGHLERIGAMLDKSLNEIYIFNAETLKFEQVNEGARHNLGYSMEELSTMTPVDIRPDVTWDQLQASVRPLLAGKKSVLVFETEHQRKDGTRYPIEVHLQRMAGDHPVFFALVLDISERKAAEQALQQSHQHFQAYFESSPIGMAAISPDKGWIEVNTAMCNIIGYDREALKRMTWTELTHPDDLPPDVAQFNRLLAGEINEYALDKRFIHKSGRIVPTHLAVRGMRKTDGSVDYLVAIIEDITDRMQAQQKIEYLAHFDPLTSLPNRTLLNDRVNHMLQHAARNNTGLAVLYLDLDRFKNVNDSLGHTVGDTLLQQVAHRMQHALREEDTVSRIGGDEFVAMLPATDGDGAARVATKLLDMLAKPYDIDQYQLIVTASIGIAMYPENGSDFASLSRAADSALYRAKQTGRNNYQFFTDEMHQKALRTMQVEVALRQALEKNQLVLHYQPQVEAVSGRIVGVEALVRWEHPEWGMTPPVEFIPIAEEVGLIVEIGNWVMQEAVRQNAAWRQSGLNVVPVAVNLSIAQFKQSNLVELVQSVLHTHALPPGLLELELTESIAMENIEFTIDTVRQLHALGPKLSIDDFGTGYSSLSYLKQFDVDKLKIDKSFVQNLGHDVNDEAIVIAIINMAKSLGFKVIAEGVETVEQLAFLRARQCDEVQGYLYSTPVPPEAFGQMLAGGGVLQHA